MKLFANVLFHKQLLCIFFANINRKLAFASISLQMLLLFTTHLHECVGAAYVLHTFTTHLHEWVAAAYVLLTFTTHLHEWVAAAYVLLTFHKYLSRS